MKSLYIVILFEFIFIFHGYGWSTKDTTNTSKQSIYLEMFGNGGFYSINYDEICYTVSTFKISWRAGMCYIPPIINYNHFFSFPLQLNLIFGHNFYGELGIGYTFIMTQYEKDIFRNDSFRSIPGISAGCRLQRDQGGIFAKAGIIKFFPVNQNPSLWFGVGIGYSLKNSKK